MPAPSDRGIDVPTVVVMVVIGFHFLYMNDSTCHVNVHVNSVGNPSIYALGNI